MIFKIIYEGYGWQANTEQGEIKRASSPGHIHLYN